MQKLYETFVIEINIRNFGQGWMTFDFILKLQLKHKL